MLNDHTVERLIIYNRILKNLYKNGQKLVTSKAIAQVLSNTSAQVRRDLSSLGRKGKTGVGYDIGKLIDDIDGVLGLNRKWGLLLVGAGNLGRALFYYPGFRREGFEFRMIVDKDPRKIGKKWSGVEINSSTALRRKIRNKQIDIAVISVPADRAQEVAERVVSSGVNEIMNFAPVTLNVPEGVNVRYVDLALELENLSYQLAVRKKR
ncbi:MAG: redox-sensing transcriptional repressor Rex [Elusimicrobiota bacterium]